MPWPLCKSLARLLHWWWTRDRIRIAPGEGRLLRLKVSSIIAIEGEVLEVQQRFVDKTGCDPTIIYPCWSSAGPCELRVSFDEVVLQRGGQMHRLTEEDVEVFPPPR
jgi:hypothetical protein